MSGFVTITLELVDPDTGEQLHDETFPVELETLVGFDKGLALAYGPYRRRLLFRIKFDPPLVAAIEPADDELELG